MRRPEADGTDPDEFFTVRTGFDDPVHTVKLAGELDLASRSDAFNACTAVEHRDVLVDLSDLVFMDCAGYSALVAATSSLGRRGGSMLLTNLAGEPQRLLMMIESMELTWLGELRNSNDPESSEA